MRIHAAFAFVVVAFVTSGVEHRADYDCLSLEARASCPP